MKVIALVLLCAFAAVQGRSAVVQSTRSLAALGENPWVVHLRIAVSTSGLLNTCTGTLIGNSWVLTAASCLTNVRFIWVRYGVVNVINPSLVTENSAVRIHPGYDAASGANNIGLISINRVVHNTDNIAPVNLALSDELPDSAKFCGFGDDGAGGPGEQLSCAELSLEGEGDGAIAVSGDAEASKFDVGASLVSDGVLVGVLVSGADDESAGSFVAVSGYIDWIEEETGLQFNPDAAAPEEAEDSLVNFVN